jgi:hypothetical protein
MKSKSLLLVQCHKLKPCHHLHQLPTLHANQLRQTDIFAEIESFIVLSLTVSRLKKLNAD